MENHLQDKIVVITGTSKGLGKELALEFQRYKAIVVGCARSSSIASGIDQRACNVRSQASVGAFAQEVLQDYGAIDVWVNNAGILTRGAVGEVQERTLEDCFATNVYGAFYGCAVASKAMRQQGSGHLINIISTSGLIGRANESVYCATKWALRGLHESLKQELRDDNIRVSAIYLGGMKTNLFDEYAQNIDAFMEPRDVAELIVHLANTQNDLAPTELTIQRGNSIRA